LKELNENLTDGVTEIDEQKACQTELNLTKEVTAIDEQKACHTELNLIKEVTATDEQKACQSEEAPLSDTVSNACFQSGRSGEPLRVVVAHPVRDPPTLTRRSTFHQEDNCDAESKDEKSSAPNVLGSVEPWESTLTRRRPKPQSGVISQERSVDSINLLNTIYPEGLNGVSEKQQEWTEVVFAVDSGATETVMNEEMLEDVETIEGRAFKRGVKYEVANGVRIDNLGEKRFTGITTEGSQRGITAQICEVNKALLSVRKVVSAGNKVVFDDVSYIEDKDTGERILIEDQGGMYVLKMWVRDESF